MTSNATVPGFNMSLNGVRPGSTTVLVGVAIATTRSGSRSFLARCLVEVATPMFSAFPKGT